MAMNLLLESLSRCLNGTSTVRGTSASAGLGNANHHDDDLLDQLDLEPAEVQVRLRDHGRTRRSTSSRRSASGGRRRSTTPKNRNGRRRSEYDCDDHHYDRDDDEPDLVRAEADDVDRLADARRDAHRRQASNTSNDKEGRSPSRRRRRQRSSPKLTVEERRNDIFRLPSDHPASRPSSPANQNMTAAADPNSNSNNTTAGRSRSSPRIRVVSPEPHPIGLVCGRTSPAVFRRGSSAPGNNGGGGASMSMSNLLRDSTGGLRALCFASPVRDSQEVFEERRAELAAAAAAANAANNEGYPADDRTVDTFSLLRNPTDDPTVNTADYTHATQDDTIASTHYFDAKLAHMVETSPPMPLYRQYEVSDTNPDHDIRRIVETNSHRSIRDAGVDLAGGLINVVKKKWSSPDRRAAPQSRRESRRQPAGTTAAATASSSSPTSRPKKTSSNDPPTPPRHPRGYREEVVVVSQSSSRRRSNNHKASPHKLSGHPSEDSSVPSLEFSRNSSQSTSPSI